MVDVRHAPDFLEINRGNFYGIRSGEQNQDVDYDDEFYLRGPEPGKVRTHHVYNFPQRQFLGTFISESIIVQQMSFLLSDQYGLPMVYAPGQTIFEWNEFAMDQPVLTRNPPEGVAPTFRSTKKGRSTTIDRSGIQCAQEYDFSQTEDGRRMMALMIQRFQQAAVLSFSVDALYALKAARTEYHKSLADQRPDGFARRCLEYARKFCVAIKSPEGMANRVLEVIRLLKARGVVPNVIYADYGGVPYFSPMLDPKDQTMIVQGPIPPENWVDPYPADRFLGLRVFYPNEAYDGDVLETPLIRLRIFGEYYTLSGANPAYINANYTTFQRTIEIVDIELGRYVKISIQDAMENYFSFLDADGLPGDGGANSGAYRARIPPRPAAPGGAPGLFINKNDIFRSGNRGERALDLGRMDPLFVSNELLRALASCVRTQCRKAGGVVDPGVVPANSNVQVASAWRTSYGANSLFLKLQALHVSDFNDAPFAPPGPLGSRYAVKVYALKNDDPDRPNAGAGQIPRGDAVLLASTQPAWAVARTAEDLQKVSQANLDLLKQARNGAALAKSYDVIATSKEMMKSVIGANFVKNVAARLENATEVSLQGLEDHFNHFLTGTDEAKVAARAELTKAPEVTKVPEVTAATPALAVPRARQSEYKELTQDELNDLSDQNIDWAYVRPNSSDVVLTKEEAEIQEGGLQAGMGIRFPNAAAYDRFRLGQVRNAAGDLVDYDLEEDRAAYARLIATDAELKFLFTYVCGLRVSKELFRTLAANDLPIPFDFLVVRPFIQIRTSSLLIGKPNEAGFYVVGQDNLMYAPDVAHKVWLVNYTVFHGPVINNPSAIEWMDDVYPAPNGYVAGYAAKFYFPDDWLNLKNNNFVHTGDPREPTMVALIVPYGSGERIEHVIDIRGYFSAEDETNDVDPHFITDWRHHGSLGINMVQSQFEPTELNDKYAFNVLYRGHQRSWDMAKNDFLAYTQSMSPFGPKTAPDMLPIWNGERASRNLLQTNVNAEQYRGY